MWEKKVTQILEELNSNQDGISEKEAKQRLIINGKNELPKGRKKKIWDIFFSQFKSPIIIILIVAAIFSIMVNSIADAIFIFIVIAINSVMATIQEWNSERSAEKLQEMIKIKVSVIRDGIKQNIDSEEIVVRRYCKFRIW